MHMSENRTIEIHKNQKPGVIYVFGFHFAKKHDKTHL